MIFTETLLKGAYIIELEKLVDERGFFSRVYCDREFEEHGLNTHYVQSNISYNCKKGTLRGMHRQLSPYEEIKLVRCVKGSIYDVILDLREDSETYLQWYAVELTQNNHKTLYIPEGLAHGFLTLEDDVEVFYQHSQFYTPEVNGSVRWDDPAFGISWPGADNFVISNNDQKWPDFIPSGFVKKDI